MCVEGPRARIRTRDACNTITLYVGALAHYQHHNKYTKLHRVALSYMVKYNTVSFYSSKSNVVSWQQKYAEIYWVNMKINYLFIFTLSLSVLQLHFERQFQLYLHSNNVLFNLDQMSGCLFHINTIK